ncbi:MAG: pentapeptide repeat-containing protein [Chthonomonas sp.]|nr:pentapeptide repeat-containing protein [Chthonomonas sp.]
MHRIHNTKTAFEAFDAELEPANMRNLQMSGAKFEDSNLEKSQFSDTNLSSAEFSNVNFTSAHFENCDFNGATLNGVLIEDLMIAYRLLKRQPDRN